MTVTVAPGIAPLVESTTLPTIPEDADSWALSPAVRSHKATSVTLPSLRVMLPPMENTCECSCTTLPNERFWQTAVDRNHVSSRLRTGVAGEPADGVRAIPRQNRLASDRSFRIEGRQFRPQILGRLAVFECDVVLLQGDNHAIAREHRRTGNDGGRCNAIDAHQRPEADGELADQVVHGGLADVVSFAAALGHDRVRRAREHHRRRQLLL